MTPPAPSPHHPLPPNAVAHECKREVMQLERTGSLPVPPALSAAPVHDLHFRVALGSGSTNRDHVIYARVYFSANYFSADLKDKAASHIKELPTDDYIFLAGIDEPGASGTSLHIPIVHALWMHAQEKSDRRCRIFTFDYPEFGRSSGAASASPEAYSMNDLGSLLVHLLLHAEVGFLTSGTGHPHASNALTLVAHEVGALVAATALLHLPKQTMHRVELLALVKKGSKLIKFGANYRAPGQLIRAVEACALNGEELWTIRDAGSQRVHLMYGREDESQESMQKAVQLLRGRGTPPEKPIITAFRDVTGVKRHFYSGKIHDQITVDTVFRFILLQDFLLDGRNDTKPLPPFCRPCKPKDEETAARHDRARELMLLVWPDRRGTADLKDTLKYSA